jgi:FkbM family methyltransferase
VRLNRLDNVRAFPHAVGGQASERATIYAVGEAVQHRTANAEAVAAPAYSVASLSLEQALGDVPQCDFLKMDCEGAEYAILFNASEAALGKIRRMCLEVHDGVTAHSRQELAQYLRSKGFQVRLEPNPVHGQLGFLYATHP